MLTRPLGRVTPLSEGRRAAAGCPCEHSRGAGPRLPDSSRFGAGPEIGTEPLLTAGRKACLPFSCPRSGEGSRANDAPAQGSRPPPTVTSRAAMMPTSRAPEAPLASACRRPHERAPQSPSNHVRGPWKARAGQSRISDERAVPLHFARHRLARPHLWPHPEPLGPLSGGDIDVPGLFLTDDEIAALCAPLKQPAAQVRFLRASGLTVTVKPNGRPAVVRSHAEAVLSGCVPAAPCESEERPAVAAAPRPNIDGFLQVIGGGKKNGPQKKVQPA